jgi:branched-chain amino acid transport system permease protein
MDILGQQLINGVTLGCAYAVVAIGFGLIFSVMRVVNLAHPDFMMLGAYSVFGVTKIMTSAAPTANPFLILVLMVVVAVVISATAGLIVGETIVRPLRGHNVLIPFLATAGASIVIQNAVQVVFGPDPVGIAGIIPSFVVPVGLLSFTSAQVLVVVIAILILAGISFYVRGTRSGLAARALAERPDVTASCGVNINAVSRRTMMISAGSAGLAGLGLALLSGSASPTMGATYGVKSFVCMLVAGNRRIEGIMLVGLAVGVTEVLISGYLSSSYRDVLTYSLLIGVLFLRPGGIFGSYKT